MRQVVLASLMLGFAAPSLGFFYSPPRGGVENYEVIPKNSIFVRSGGVAGLEDHYAVAGSFGFAVDELGGPHPPPGQPVSWRQGARFTDVDLCAPLGEFVDGFIDVGYLLNLENLRGEALPIAAPFDVFRFEGLINDSDATSPLEQSTIELYAAVVGPWMYLYGETTPPPFYSDRFEYEIRAVARSGRWADMNADGVVDAADYTALRDASASSSASLADLPTLQEWAAQYGETPDMGTMDSLAAMATARAMSVPEPSAATVCLVATGFGAVLRRRRSGAAVANFAAA